MGQYIVKRLLLLIPTLLGAALVIFLPERRVVIKHALKNAFLPVITIIGTEIAFLIGGLVVTETVFTLNGLGRFMVDAIARRDIPVVQTLVLLIAFSLRPT